MGLRQDLYEAVYDLLTNANLLSSTVTVTAAFIDKDSASFPQVVVNPVDISKSNYTFDRSYSNKDIQIIIDIWTKKNKDKDLIADEIDALIPSSLAGCMQTGWTESNALESPGSNKLHLKSITISFMKG